MLGTLVLIGGAPAERAFSLDHLRRCGASGSSACSAAAAAPGSSFRRSSSSYQQGRFPFDRLVQYYELGEIEQALADSKSGEVIKPVLRMPQQPGP